LAQQFKKKKNKKKKKKKSDNKKDNFFSRPKAIGKGKKLRIICHFLIAMKINCYVLHQVDQILSICHNLGH
jgi:hypothetical protein